MLRPKLSLLDKELTEHIVDEALEVLEKIGIFVENKEAMRLFKEVGMQIDEDKRKVFITRELVEKSLATAPKKIELYDAFGNLKMCLEKDNVHFDPGSAALNVLDWETGDIRKAVTRDFLQFSKIVDKLDNLSAQSTSFICSDVPDDMADSYRLFIALQNCSKPVITGTFRTESFAVMKDMLIAVRGSEEALRAKPLAIFDACPSPPLKWSNLTCQSLIDCARLGIPSELVSMPLCGATAPVTISGSLVQHTAENLSGIVINQLACSGAPIIYGGSPSLFDMRKGTTPMGAIETMMIDSAYSQIGKSLGMPTHAYMGLSDTKAFDYQGGFESGMGILMAALAGINVVSGAGMLDFESCQSIEKLVMDNEICGMALRLVKGIVPRETPYAINILQEALDKGHFLSLPSTVKWFKEEFYYPDKVVDRGTSGEWEKKGKISIKERIKEKVKKILSAKDSYCLSDEKKAVLHELMMKEAQIHGLSKLPS